MAQTYVKKLEVRWDDVDVNGHLRNTRYLEYANHARISYFQESGWDARRFLAAEVGPVLLSDEIRYRREVFLAEEVEVTCQVTGLSADGARWEMRHEVRRADGSTAATVLSHGGWMGKRTRKLTAPPADLIAAVDAIRSEDCALIEISADKPGAR
jgi:acyl-CoA thioester hydrolase